MENKIEIIDESGDKEYFTIVPNYILNHSTSDEQSLYLQMKRFAGEQGKCFATIKTLAGKLHWREGKVRRNIEKLLRRNWIERIGIVKGRTHPINAYRIMNLWQLNTEFYKKKKAVPNDTNSEKEKRRHAQTTVRRHAQTTAEEEPTIKKNQEELQRQSVATTNGNEINQLIEKFKVINPSYERLFSNNTQRGAMARLLKKMGRQKLEQVLDILPKIFGKPYAPRITTPLKLEEKLADLISYVKIEKEKGNRVFVI